MVVDEDFTAFNGEIPESLIARLNENFDEEIPRDHEAEKVASGWNPRWILLLLLLFIPFLTNLTPQKASETRNLALKSEGARVLEGYTTPPSKSVLLELLQKYSDRYRLDAECIIRPSAECWPLTSVSTVGIELGHVAKVSSISIDLRPNSEKFEDLYVYSILNYGEISQVGRSYTYRVDFRRPIEAANFVLRIRFKDGGHGCLNNVIIEGSVEGA